MRFWILIALAHCLFCAGYGRRLPFSKKKVAKSLPVERHKSPTVVARHRSLSAHHWLEQQLNGNSILDVIKIVCARSSHCLNPSGSFNPYVRMLDRKPLRRASTHHAAKVQFANLLQSPYLGKARRRTTSRLPAGCDHPRMSVAPNAAILDIFESPITWGVGISLLLSVIYKFFERTIETARANTPKYVQPSVDRLLAELSALGFIGLLVEADTFGLANGAFSLLSEKYLGAAPLGYELFEGVHQTLFRAAVAYFASCSFLVFGVVQGLGKRFQTLDADGDGIVTLDDAIASEDVVVSRLGNLKLRKSFEGKVEYCEVASIRCADMGGVSMKCLQDATGNVLTELVEVDPLTVFLITTPIELPSLVLQLTAKTATVTTPGQYEELLPPFLLGCGTILALSYALYQDKVISLGQKFRDQEYLLESIKAVSFAAAYVFALCLPQVFTDTAALFSSEDTSKAVYELTAVSLGLGTMGATLLRMNSVLYEYILSLVAAILKQGTEMFGRGECLECMTDEECLVE